LTWYAVLSNYADTNRIGVFRQNGTFTLSDSIGEIGAIYGSPKSRAVVLSNYIKMLCLWAILEEVMRIEICPKLQTTISVQILYAREKNKVFSFLNNLFFLKGILMKYGILIKNITEFYYLKFHRKICINK